MKNAITFGLLVILLSSSAGAAEQPNIILIYTDDHGWPDIGAAGIYDDLKTPNIDRLAAGGARCTNGYVSAPQCVPSRGGILSGRDQSRFGLETNASSLDGFNAEITIADRLKKVGYATGQIGKWHLGPVQEITSHGFDDVFAKNSNRPGWTNYGLDGSDQEPGLENTGMYHLDACSAAATAFIDRHSDGPFFLYLAYRAPHVPLDAPAKYLSRFPGKMPERRRQALAMISAMDDGIGAIREKLGENELTEKTLIFFIGDNGAPLKIHKIDAPGGGPGWDGSLNAPMNGEKGMLSEGGIRVPFVVNWPGMIPAGQVYEKPVISLDVAATAVALSGAEASKLLDGVNIIPHLNGDIAGAPHEALFWRWASQSAIREGKWKLLIGGSREYLYDIVSDPYETTNLIESKSELAARLKARLVGWTQELDPPGLITGMADTWNKYFDYYLDGKPASPPQERKTGPKDTSGWIGRNAELTMKNGKLFIHDLNGKQRLAPFIEINQLDWNGPVTLTMKATLASGEGGISTSWRCSDQSDFVNDLGKTFEKVGPDSFAVTIPEKRKIVHLRVRFPEGNVAIEQITASSEEGKILKRWTFD